MRRIECDGGDGWGCVQSLKLFSALTRGMNNAAFRTIVKLQIAQKSFLGERNNKV